MKTASPSPTTPPVARKPRALIVPPEVLALKNITLTAKLVLAEIIDLYKVNGHVFASDEYFANRLGISLRTVGDAIKQLCEHGLLTRMISPRARHKRVLTPVLSSPNLAASKVECLQIPQEQSPTVKANSAASTSEICNESLQNSPAVPAKSADINTRVNNQLNSNLTFRGKAALAAPLNEKKRWRF
jgi:hypothetical protein